ncbi:MAG: 2-succinyl-5-enolpyruvyl-6-hydroxy-3-cyclohexene-1-carboxylate synthase [Spirosomataceae bacterium]|jgi:2-succinyl-5-enolpyruvyl-6-hydroxy-3-cyclohexene-1-carboxylate synthase
MCLFFYDMAIIQTLIDCVEVCAEKGIENVILCPGSRNAALIVAFEQNPKINCFSISDERAAAFVAMGMALESKKTVAIVCTSGTAALNFIPAAAEAILQEIPLLILTADRPPEWINQYDGQTVFQNGAFGQHVKRNFALLPDYEKSDVDWFANRVFNEAINLSQQPPLGPVQINIPIREPFYPADNEVVQSKTSVHIISNALIKKSIDEKLAKDLVNEIESSASVWIVVGQQNDPELDIALAEIKELPNVLIIGDVISNVESQIDSQDILFKQSLPDFKPDLLITCGKSLITKSLKLFLRNSKVRNHWHVQESETIRDPYQSVSELFNINPVDFFNSLHFTSDSFQQKSESLSQLIKHDQKIIDALRSKMQYLTFSDIHCVNTLLSITEKNSVLHLGNSLSVRYVNLLKHKLNAKSIIVECNRGTSGIEGTLSTAVGYAMSTNKKVYCLIGDVSFQYDKNALWHNYIPDNLKIIVLNNSGGNIFRMIPGPKSQSAYKEFFETTQQHSARRIAEHYKVDYLPIRNISETTEVSSFLKKAGCSIIEFFTEPEENERAFKELMNIKIS